MHDPFDSSDALIRDLPHVRVKRKAAPAGRLCRYEKIFKPEGLGDAGYWIQRENEFLLDFTLKNLRHVVQLASVVRDGDGLETPVVESVVTLDAGVTIEDWLRVQPCYANGLTGLHPFQHAGSFLHLLRACLVALREIHRLGIVHCDIKEDNICLPYSPYPFRPEQPLALDYERIRLIDFAFSVTPERPLQCPLPILPAAPYQSNLLKTALREDRSGKYRGAPAAQKLDYRADLYSLGYLAGRILDTGLLQPAGSEGVAAMEGARGLVERLKACDSGRWRGGRALPHDGWIEEIDALLAPLRDVEAYRRFEIARVRDDQAPEPGAGGVAPTPLTPLALSESVSAPAPHLPQVRRRPARLGLPGLLAALLLAGVAGLAYWVSGRVSESPAGVATRDEGRTPPGGAGAKPEKSGREAEAEARRKAEEQARWKAEAEAMLKAEAAKAERQTSRGLGTSTFHCTDSGCEPVQQTAREAGAGTKPGAGLPSTAQAEIEYPGPGGSVGRIETIRGRLHGITSGQSAFLVIRSTADEYGRLFYPQGELPPYPPEWTLKGVFGTPNYEYQVFVVGTGNPASAELLRAPRSRAYGLKSLPEDTRVIGSILTVRRTE